MEAKVVVFKKKYEGEGEREIRLFIGAKGIAAKASEVSV